MRLVFLLHSLKEGNRTILSLMQGLRLLANKEAPPVIWLALTQTCAVLCRHTNVCDQQHRRCLVQLRRTVPPSKMAVATWSAGTWLVAKERRMREGTLRRATILILSRREGVLAYRLAD